jgi:ABC-type transport system involved in cytochrome c biogenesis ATPase subunit
LNGQLTKATKKTAMIKMIQNRSPLLILSPKNAPLAAGHRRQMNHHLMTGTASGGMV